MQLDKALLRDLLPTGKAILHFYDWQTPSLTYGHFLKIEQCVRLERIKKYFTLARRPTGGGVTFHVTDLAFSVLIPSSASEYSTNTLANYRYINDKVKGVVMQLMEQHSLALLERGEEVKSEKTLSSQFCMAHPTVYDVMLSGKKIAGAAQRRGKGGFLHQGSIALALPNIAILQDVLPQGSAVLEDMQRCTHSLLPACHSLDDLHQMRHDVRQLLKRAFMDE